MAKAIHKVCIFGSQPVSADGVLGFVLTSGHAATDFREQVIRDTFARAAQTICANELTFFKLLQFLSSFTLPVMLRPVFREQVIRDTFAPAAQTICANELMFYNLL